MDTVPNWLFLTGSAAQLQQVWGRYGIFVSHMAPGASSVMRDLVFVIDKNGRIRQQILDNPVVVRRYAGRPGPADTGPMTPRAHGWIVPLSRLRRSWWRSR